MKRMMLCVGILTVLTALPLMAEVDRADLLARTKRSAVRLEAEKYRPDRIFLTEAESGGWPGDTEGRTLLALVLQYQALGEKPKYLDAILRELPRHLNAKGYFGPTREGIKDEQQLSGNGWMLRALCEYELRVKDKVLPVRPIIQSIATNLFAAEAELYAEYPIDPAQRTIVGKECGTVSGTTAHWRLSSDIGCVFIGLDGMVQAHEVLKDESLVRPIETLVGKFLAMDLVATKAQTHASLTAMRALLRHDAKQYLGEVEKRFALYRQFGMTDDYANYNWFTRYDTWTEPCAIADSYLLARRLHQLTGKAEYAQLAEATLKTLCAHQCENGGFGLKKTAPKGTVPPTGPIYTEAHWCCTMRGGATLAASLLPLTPAP